MKTYNIEQVANWFLSQSSMTKRKLQILTYYFEAWGHALFNRSLIHDTNFKAQDYGPISPKLDQLYKEYKWDEIEQLSTKNDSEFDENSLFLLESVWETYGDLSINELSVLTCNELPYIIAKRNLNNPIINTNDMREFYLSIYSGD